MSFYLFHSTNVNPWMCLYSILIKFYNSRIMNWWIELNIVCERLADEECHSHNRNMNANVSLGSQTGPKLHSFFTSFESNRVHWLRLFDIPNATGVRQTIQWTSSIAVNLFASTWKRNPLRVHAANLRKLSHSHVYHRATEISEQKLRIIVQTMRDEIR